MLGILNIRNMKHAWKFTGFCFETAKGAGVLH
jgi:hypothetical protein